MSNQQEASNGSENSFQVKKEPQDDFNVFLRARSGREVAGGGGSVEMLYSLKGQFT